MKDNNELEITDIVVDDDIQIDSNDLRQIEVCLETWFDVDKKFGLGTNKNDDEWVNLYAFYNPFEEKLSMKYLVESSKDVQEFDYTPTDNEKNLITKMIADKINKLYTQTPKEFCLSFIEDNEMTMGEQT